MKILPFCRFTLLALCLGLVLAGCGGSAPEPEAVPKPPSPPSAASTPQQEKKDPAEADEQDAAARQNDQLAKATFAGGCFWCLEIPLEKLDGVEAVISGYTGGPEVNPTYQDVAGGRTGHREAIQVLYDPSKISYEKILATFWQQINPTDPGGQFVDRGPQYATGIFYADEAQKQAAERSKQLIADSGLFKQPIVTPIEPAGPFYPAELYHQNFYLKDPRRYYGYRSGSGRDTFINRTWKTRPELFNAFTAAASAGG